MSEEKVEVSAEWVKIQACLVEELAEKNLEIAELKKNFRFKKRTNYSFSKRNW